MKMKMMKTTVRSAPDGSDNNDAFLNGILPNSVSLAEMLVAFGKDFLQNMTLTFSPFFSLKISLLEMLISFGN